VTTLLITGSRDFCESVTTTGEPRPRDTYMAERESLGFTLDYIAPSSVIVGDSSGADRWAVIWCERRGIPFTVYRADWTTHQKRAGPVRNQTMVDQRPDQAVAFPGDDDDCVQRCEAARVPVFRVSVKIPAGDCV